MHLMYTLDANGQRLYTLKKASTPLRASKKEPANQSFLTRSKLARSPNQHIQLDSVPTTNTQGIESRLRKGGLDRRSYGDIADQLVIRYGLLLTQLSE